MTEPNEHSSVPRVGLVGAFPPSRSGTSAFAGDLAMALAAVSRPELAPLVIAVNSPGAEPSYDEQVQFQIPRDDVTAYRRAAEHLNAADVDVVCVQHEQAVFGGAAGDHALAFFEALEQPVVTTLHAIVAEPSAPQRFVMGEIARLSTRLVVTSHCGRKLLRDVHGVSAKRIDLIPHGVPTTPSYEESRKQTGMGVEPTLLTFGLLRPEKGIEHVIAALPAIASRHPSVRYVVAGITHPREHAVRGEAYRRSLEALTERLGVERHVTFHDRFVEASDLPPLVAAADVHVTAYLEEGKITSGTLAHALGAGKAIVSTPFRYAKDVLDGGRGILVPPGDAAALATAITRLLGDPYERLQLGSLAARSGAVMGWSRVREQYVASFEHAIASEERSPRSSTDGGSSIPRVTPLPELDLRHLRTLTDGTGLLGQADYATPRYQEGYRLDDNARALLLTARIDRTELKETADARELSGCYLAFLRYSLDGSTGRFRSHLGYDRRWRDDAATDDSHGRALWALGAIASGSHHPSSAALAADLFDSGLPACLEIGSARGVAFALLGANEYVRGVERRDEVETHMKTLALRLLSGFEPRRRTEWPWFEDMLSYDNACLPHAMIASGRWLADDRMVSAGLESLRWLMEMQRSEAGGFAPIGSSGFYPHHSEPAQIDQRPSEASASVSACIAAWRVSGDARWLDGARAAFGWFVGDNELCETLVDHITGGCRDVLHADRVDENEGGESTVSYLLALVEMRALESATKSRPSRGLRAVPDSPSPESSDRVPSR